MSLFGGKLFTTRLCLRRVEKEDVFLLQQWSHCPECCGDYLTPEHFSREQLMQQLVSGALWNDREKHFMIELKRNGPPIGVIHYWTMAGKKNTVVMALKIAEIRQRSKGYGTEAQKFLIKYLMEVEKVDRVLMYTDINNLAQQRCLEKLGFDLLESLNYEDQQVQRTGHLFGLDLQGYTRQSIYQYHLEL
jgi:RimJ/RimL family protein N-acetyltransferase